MAHPTTYRQMRPEDEDEVFALWLATWADSDEALERRTLHSDPDYLSRTYIAAGCARCATPPERPGARAACRT